MSKTVRDEQLPTIRVAAPLKRELEAAAAEQGRSLSNLIRQILIDHTAERVANAATPTQLAA